MQFSNKHIHPSFSTNRPYRHLEPLGDDSLSRLKVIARKSSDFRGNPEHI